MFAQPYVAGVFSYLISDKFLSGFVILLIQIQ